MICSFSFEHGISDCKEDEFERLKLLNIPEFPGTVEELRKGYSWATWTFDIKKILAAVPNRKISIQAEEKPSVYLHFYDKLLEIENKLNQVSFNLEEGGKIGGQQFNSKCTVHVPNLGLLMINEVKAYTNACTENLQDQLNEGWRILAICPQPDQRRPDYILGKTT